MKKMKNLPCFENRLNTTTGRCQGTFQIQGRRGGNCHDIGHNTTTLQNPCKLSRQTRIRHLPFHLFASGPFPPSQAWPWSLLFPYLHSKSLTLLSWGLNLPLSNPSYEFSHSVYLEDLWKQNHRLWSMQAHFLEGSSLRPMLLILHMLKFYFELMDEYPSNI